jgi:hypothetical protein
LNSAALARSDPIGHIALASAPALTRQMTEATSPSPAPGESPKHPQYWLIVERFDNWEVDEADGFRVLGFSDSRRKIVDSFRPGDILFVYVARARSALADCRRVTSERPIRTFERRWNGDLYPLRISTEPVMTLPINRWVRISDLVPFLDMTRGKADWQHAVRQAVRRVEIGDAEVMMAAMRRAAAM